MRAKPLTVNSLLLSCSLPLLFMVREMPNTCHGKADDRIQEYCVAGLIRIFGTFHQRWPLKVVLLVFASFLHTTS